jgi:hypothetical protein
MNANTLRQIQNVRGVLWQPTCESEPIFSPEWGSRRRIGRLEVDSDKGQLIQRHGTTASWHNASPVKAALSCSTQACTDEAES